LSASENAARIFRNPAATQDHDNPRISNSAESSDGGVGKNGNAGRRAGASRCTLGTWGTFRFAA
jgi:hypothetical protein